MTAWARFARPDGATLHRVALLASAVAAGVLTIALMLRAGHVIGDQHRHLLHRVDEPVSLVIESETGGISASVLTRIQQAFPECSLYPIRETDGVCDARPGETLHVLGVDFIGDARLNLSAGLLGTRALSAWREPRVLLPPALQAAWGVTAGDSMTVRAAAGTLRARVADQPLPDLFHAGTDGRVVAVDLHWFDGAFGGDARVVDAIAVGRGADTPVATLERRLDARLPENLFVVRRGDRTEAARAWVEAWGVVAGLIGQVGVFAGVVVVFLAAHLGFVRKERARRDRSWVAFGRSGGEVVAGTLLGALLGTQVERLVAWLWVRFWRPDATLPVDPLGVTGISASVALFVTTAFVLAALVGAVRHHVAIRDVRPRPGIRFAVVGVLLVLASLLTVPPAMVGGLPATFAAVFALIVAGAMVTQPLLAGAARAFRWILGRAQPLLARVVSIHVSDGWPTTSVATALVVFTFGVFGIGWTVVDAMEARQRAWLAGEAAPDVVLVGSPEETAAGRRALSTEWLSPLTSHPDVASVTATRALPATVRSATFPVALVTADILHARGAGGVRTEGADTVPLALTTEGARDFGLRAGDHVGLTTASGTWPAVVTAVVPSRAGENVAALASLDEAGRLCRDEALTEIGVRFRAGVDPDRARRSLVAALPGLRPSVLGTDDIRRSAEAALETTTRGLRGLLLAFGVLGVLLALTLGPALALDVPDAFAVLGALGVPRAKLARAAAVSTTLVAGVALAVGVGASFLGAGLLLLATGAPGGFAVRTVPGSWIPVGVALLVWIAAGPVGTAWTRAHLPVPRRARTGAAA